MIRYRCPHCDKPKTYEVELNLIDKDMHCPSCGHEIDRGDFMGGEWVQVKSEDAGHLQEHAVVTDSSRPEIQQLPDPAVLAEDLRALADVVPFDDRTRAMLEQAAHHLDVLADSLTARKAPQW